MVITDLLTLSSVRAAVEAMPPARRSTAAALAPRVKLVARVEGTVRASLFDSAHVFVTVFVHKHGRPAQGSCTCASAFHCRHIDATLLAIEAQSRDPSIDPQLVASDCLLATGHCAEAVARLEQVNFVVF